MQPNAIPKIDNSKVKMPNHSVAVSKVDRYGWNKNTGKPGEYVMLNKMDLEISGDYQRHGDGKIDVDGVMSGTGKRKNAIKNIARNFSWELFGVLIVVMWKDGTLWVVDGAHRAIAARLRDDVTMLPSLVFERPDIDKDELLKMDAQLFYDSCKMRRVMDSYDKHRAATVAGHDDAMLVNEILEHRGISLTMSASTPRQFSAVNSLKTLLNKDRKRAERAFDIALSTAKSGPVTKNILTGIYYLLERSNINEKHIKLLEDIGDQAITAAITKMVAISGKGGERIYAIGVADAINTGKRGSMARVVIE